ncbi:MAG: hypothetical protein AABN33_11795 [Acidobacteriota bacterium]
MLRDGEFRRWTTILGVAFGLRLLYVITALAVNSGHTLFEILPDTRLYVSGGHLLGEHGEFLFDNKSSEGGDGELRPEVLVVPGYPAFLAVLFGIFGETAAAVLIIQAVLSSLSGAMNYAVCCHLVPAESKWWRRFLLGLFVLCPTSIIVSGFVLSDTLFEFLFVAGLLCFVRSYAAVSPGRWQLLAGALWGLALFSRPILLLWPLIVPALAWLVGLSLGKKIAWRYVLASLMIPFLVGATWTLRNWQRRGIPAFSTNGVAAMRDYFATEVEAVQQGRSFKATHAEARARFMSTRREGPEAEREQYHRMSQEASSIIRSSPVAAAKAAIRRLGEQATEDPASLLFTHFPGLQSVYAETLLTGAAKLALLLWIIGIAAMLRSGRTPLVLLALLVFGYFLALSSLSSWQGSRLMLPATTFWNLGVAAALGTIAEMKPGRLNLSRDKIAWACLWIGVFGTWFISGWSLQPWPSMLMVFLHKAVFSTCLVLGLATGFRLWMETRRRRLAK